MRRKQRRSFSPIPSVRRNNSDTVNTPAAGSNASVRRYGHVLDSGTLDIQVHEEITYEDMHSKGENLWNFLYFTGYLNSTDLHKDPNEMNPLHYSLYKAWAFFHAACRTSSSVMPLICARASTT